MSGGGLEQRLAKSSTDLLEGGAEWLKPISRTGIHRADISVSSRKIIWARQRREQR